MKRRRAPETSLAGHAKSLQFEFVQTLHDADELRSSGISEPRTQSEDYKTPQHVSREVTAGDATDDTLLLSSPGRLSIVGFTKSWDYRPTLQSGIASRFKAGKDIQRWSCLAAESAYRPGRPDSDDRLADF